MVARLAVGLVLGAVIGAAQDSAPTVIRTEASEVVVDVTVTGKNLAPGSLAEKDFTIQQDGKTQKINSVLFTGGAANADPDTSRKHFVVYLDFTTMPITDQGLARTLASDFVTKMASPDRYMAVLAMNGSGSRVVQSFTNAVPALRSAIASVGVSGGTTLYPLANAQASLQAVGKSLSGSPGRKVILFFTGGYGFTQGDPELEKTLSILNRANIAVYVVASRTSLADPSAMPGTGAAAPAGGRGGRGGAATSIQSAAQTAGDFAAVLAQSTGGEFLRFDSQLPQELAVMAREQDEFYRLTYTPPAAKEGSCHSIKVSVARGLIARARNEYCTEKPVDVVAGRIEGQALEAKATGSAGAIHPSMQLPWFYSGPNRASIHVSAVALLTGMKFESTKTGQHGEIDIVGALTRQDGSVAARFADSIDIDQPDKQQADAFAHVPWRYEHAFSAAPGTYTFKLSVGAGGNAVGNAEAPVVIERRDVNTLAIGGIALCADVRDAGGIGDDALLETSAPLSTGGKEFLPAPDTRFRADQRVYFYNEVYEPSLATDKPAVLTAEFRIFDESGAVRYDSGVAGLAGFVHPGNPVVPFATLVQLAKLAPGKYRLEIGVGHSTGPETVTRSTTFEIVR